MNTETPTTSYTSTKRRRLSRDDCGNRTAELCPSASLLPSASPFTSRGTSATTATPADLPALLLSSPQSTLSSVTSVNVATPCGTSFSATASANVCVSSPCVTPVNLPTESLSTVHSGGRRSSSDTPENVSLASLSTPSGAPSSVVQPNNGVGDSSVMKKGFFTQVQVQRLL